MKCRCCDAQFIVVMILFQVVQNFTDQAKYAIEVIQQGKCNVLVMLFKTCIGFVIGIVILAAESRENFKWSH
jgi:hypothetical protein